MKKIYITPTIELEDIEISAELMTASNGKAHYQYDGETGGENNKGGIPAGDFIGEESD